MLQRDYYKGLSEERDCGAILKSELGGKIERTGEKEASMNAEFSQTKKSHLKLNCQFMEIS